MILPFKKPPIGAFSHQASLYGILCAYPITEHWRQCNYINIYTLKTLADSEREGTLDFYFNAYGDFSYYEHLTNPFLRSNRIMRTTAIKMWGSVEEYVLDRLNAGEYVFIVVNSKRIFNLNYDRFHPMILYGHNRGEEILGYDNHPNGSYNAIHISKSMFADCFTIPVEEEHINNRLEGIITHLFRVYEDDLNKMYHSFQLHKLRNDLCNYMHPRRSEDDLYVYGIDCYDSLIQYILSVNEHNKGHLDVRAISTLYDHKVLMLLRLRYLQSRYAFCEALIGQYENEVWNIIRITRLLLLKFNCHNKEDLINRIVKHLTDAKAAEIALLDILINRLSDKGTL